MLKLRLVEKKVNRKPNKCVSDTYIYYSVCFGNKTTRFYHHSYKNKQYAKSAAIKSINNWNDKYCELGYKDMYLNGYVTISKKHLFLDDSYVDEIYEIVKE